MAGSDEPRAALQRSHERLAALVEPLTAPQITGSSYDAEWTIAQVCSHLGSGAHIFGRYLQAGLDGAPPPGPDDFAAIWALWNGKSPERQVRDSLVASAEFLDVADAIRAQVAPDWRVEMFGTGHALDGVVRMRLSEHALHTWDVAVALDPSATVPADATALILDQLPALVARAGQPVPEPLTVAVTTSDPGSELTLVLAPSGVRLAPGHPAAGDATLQLPAEALVRLAYGRLDPAHTPAAVTVRGVELDLLRRAFPGF